MRALGLDIGEARVGVAVSDPAGTVATPLKVLPARSLAADPSALARLVADYEAEAVVVGLPLSLDGTEGPQAARVRAFASRLASALPVPVEYWDERLTSAEARRTMTAAGVSDRDKRGSVDMVAAALLLQGWLDARRAPR